VSLLPRFIIIWYPYVHKPITIPNPPNTLSRFLLGSRKPLGIGVEVINLQNPCGNFYIISIQDAIVPNLKDCGIWADGTKLKGLG